MQYEYPNEITSDQMFRAYGESLTEVLVHAAMAMFGIMYDFEETEASESVQVEAWGSNEESLLYDWLSNLLIEFEVEGIFFTDFSIEKIEPDSDGGLHLIGFAKGSSQMPELRTHVKGVTLHRFSLKRNNNQYVATVVVDV